MPLITESDYDPVPITEFDDNPMPNTESDYNLVPITDLDDNPVPTTESDYDLLVVVSFLCFNHTSPKRQILSSHK